MGNCLYSSLKKGFGVRLTMEKEFPYYPNRYFHRQVADWMVRNRQRVMMAKGPYLCQAYGIADPDATFPGPYSYREYCCNVLDHRFWGDAIVLYAVSCMWALKITVVDSKTLQQYRVRHSVPLRDADVIVAFNSSSHFTAAGKCCFNIQAPWSLVICSLSFSWSLV